jgi:hypothetical protein
MLSPSLQLLAHKKHDDSTNLSGGKTLVPFTIGYRHDDVVYKQLL